MGLRSIPGIDVTVLAAGITSAQINAEYRVKPAFLCNFAKFVEWPPDRGPAPSDAIAVCASGTSPSGETLALVVEWQTMRSQPLCRRQIRTPGKCEINRAAADDQALTISSKLPSMAEGPTQIA